MKKIDFNRNWIFEKRGQEGIPVTLPHDAMIHEKRSADAEGGIGTAYFPGGTYIYRKTFSAPGEWKDQTAELLFEGVYRNAEAYVNGTKAAFHAYGYTPFLVKLDDFLNYGGENTLEVHIDNSAQPNSRWYSGSGIYRPVWLLLGNKEHIDWQGIRVTTESIDPAVIRVDVACTSGKDVPPQTHDALQKADSSRPEAIPNQSGSENPEDPAHTENPLYKDGSAASHPEVSIEIVKDGAVISTRTGCGELTIPDAELWSADHPALYTCRVKLTGDGELYDEAETEFGIRMLSWNAKQGFLVNGIPTDLRGGCIHHDNGILGAAEYEESAFRRVRIMKETGFNAIRSAHNPISEALLKACDHLGMYIMDELSDMWYMAKNKYDYHLDFSRCWQEDTRAMVERDYDHPSVVLYSIGNEVSEPCEQKGIDTGRKIVEYIHALDDTRPVTCGTNLMIISRAKKGIGIYDDSDKNSEEQKKATKAEGNQNASLMYNIMASFIGPGMNKAGNSSSVDRLVTPFCDVLDISGYNYASGRYLMDGKLHPERVIFGSETFPQDIEKNWELVKSHPYLVGDFMWAGWDYLGEVGIGAWSYTGGMPFARPFPWILAGSGVIDITGRPDASGRYASVVWEAIDRPVIGVRPVNHPGVHPSKSVWRATNAIESWSWTGCEHNMATVEVYGHGKYAELLLNGRRIGRKPLRHLKAMFQVRYTPGTLTAVIFDEHGNETGRTSLTSANGPLHIAVTPEKETAEKGQIVYIDLSLQDQNGVEESNADRDLTVRVEGGELLAVGSANPCTEQRYDGNTFCTWYGHAQAVVRSYEEGEMTVTVTAGGLGESSASVLVK